MERTYPRSRNETCDPPAEEDIAACLKTHWQIEEADIRPTSLSRRVWYVNLPEQEVVFRANPGWDGITPPPLIVKYLDHLSRSGAPAPAIYPTARGDLFASWKDYTISLESRLPGETLFRQGVKYLDQVGQALARFHCAGETFPDMPGRLCAVRDYADVLFQRSLLRMLEGDELSAVKCVEKQVQSHDLDKKVPWVMRHGDMRTANTVGSEADGIWLTDFDSTVFEPALADVVMVRTQWRNADGGDLKDLECAGILKSYHEERPLNDNEIELCSVIWVCYYVDRITFLLDRRRKQNSKKRAVKLRECVLNFPESAFAMGDRVLEIAGVTL